MGEVAEQDGDALAEPRARCPGRRCAGAAGRPGCAPTAARGGRRTRPSRRRGPARRCAAAPARHRPGPRRVPEPSRARPPAATQPQKHMLGRIRLPPVTVSDAEHLGQVAVEQDVHRRRRRTVAVSRSSTEVVAPGLDQALHHLVQPPVDPAQELTRSAWLTGLAAAGRTSGITVPASAATRWRAGARSPAAVRAAATRAARQLGHLQHGPGAEHERRQPSRLGHVRPCHPLPVQNLVGIRKLRVVRMHGPGRERPGRPRSRRCRWRRWPGRRSRAARTPGRRPPCPARGPAGGDRCGHRLTRPRMAAAGVGPDPRPGRLGQRPAGDQHLTRRR